MAKLSNIGIENFRVFNEFTEFDISPITVLTGPNSSGKSSLFKALLLLKNNSSVNSLWKLDFSGNRHKLGTFKTTKNAYALDSDVISFRIEFEVTVDSNDSRRYRSIISNRPVSTIKGVKLIPYESTSGKREAIGLAISYKRDGNNGKLTSLEFYNPENKKTYIYIYLAESASQLHSLFMDIKLCQESVFFSKAIVESFSRYSRSSIDSLEDHIEVEISPFISDELGKKVFNDDFAQVLGALESEMLSRDKNERIRSFVLDRLLQIILSPLLSVLGHFEYIEAFRANTRRIYTNDSQGTSFNELLVEYSSSNISPIGKRFLNKWLSMFKIADKILFEKIEGVANSIYLQKGKEKKLLADLGFGITQFLPILMRIALQEPLVSSSRNSRRREKPIKKLILLEEPETNLHPRFQSLVADMITDAVNSFEVRFIIETHSEYLIRKLQYLTAIDEIEPEETCIYYIYDLEEKPKDANHVEQININSDGRLDGEFGNGFFDEANSIIGKMWEAR